MTHIDTSSIFTLAMAKEIDILRLAEQLKALGDPTRLRILQLLPPTKTCELVLNVSELADKLGIPQPTVSHHLKVLHTAGIVQCAKMCRDVYYWVDSGVVNELMGLVERLAGERGTE